MKNLYRSWKTTLIGLLLIGIASAYILNNGDNVWMLVVTMVSGIGLLFLPDTFLGSISNLIEKNKDKKF